MAPPIVAAAVGVFFWRGGGGVVISTCSIDSEMASLVRGEFSNAEDMDRVRLSPDGGVNMCCGVGVGGGGGRATTSMPSKASFLSTALPGEDISYILFVTQLTVHIRFYV